MATAIIIIIIIITIIVSSICKASSNCGGRCLHLLPCMETPSQTPIGRLKDDFPPLGTDPLQLLAKFDGSLGVESNFFGDLRGKIWSRAS